MKTTKTKAAAKAPAKKAAAAGKAAKVDPKTAKGATAAKGRKRT